MLNQSDRPIILVFLSHYLPAYKAGGQLRTIANMVEHLSDEFEFWIVTSDRDLGDAVAFPTIKADSWQKVGKTNVYYASPSFLTLKNVAKLIADTSHDVLYLNSFFSFSFSIKPLLAVKYLHVSSKPVVIAPRGEFSLGALQLKKIKKKIFIGLSCFIKLHDKFVFQASSEYELQDICRVLGVKKDRIYIAMDLPELLVDVPVEKAINTYPEDDLRVVFLSRISPMKNIAFALQALKSIKRGVTFDIYGPKEDMAYWQACELLISSLPEHVKVRYLGSIEPRQVRSVFAQYDLFFFPTRGENYGHVIAESLQVGTPVLISDQTPWRNLESDGLGWELPLSSMEGFCERIEVFEPMYRAAVQQSAFERLNDVKVIEDNRQLFYSLINA